MRDLKANALAKKLGISKGYYSLIESGARAPNIRLMKKLARLIGIPGELMFRHCVENRCRCNAGTRIQGRIFGPRTSADKI